MKKEIEWFEDDGCMGGQRGLVFNLENNIITKWNGVVEELSKDNISDVKWCIEMNINSINERIGNINCRLNLKETKRTKIDGGYKTSEPLTENQRANFQVKLNDLISELVFLKSLSYE